jgi:hypothetical protein
MMKPVTEAKINGRTYHIQSHPYGESMPIALELARSIQSHVMMASKQPTVDAMKKLKPEEKKRIEDCATDEERQKLFIELVVPKMDQMAMMGAAVNFLQTMEPEKMASLINRCFAYVGGYDPLIGVPLKDVVPLFKAVVEHNDFLDLDASDLLQALA